MYDLEKKVGLRIKQIRKAAKKTQGELAEEAKLSAEYISRLERGIAMPSFRTIEAISSVLGVHERDLFDFGGPVMPGYAKDEDGKKQQYLDSMFATLYSMDFRELKMIHRIVTFLAEE